MLKALWNYIIGVANYLSMTVKSPVVKLEISEGQFITSAIFILIPNYCYSVLVAASSACFTFIGRLSQEKKCLWLVNRWAQK